MDTPKPIPGARPSDRFPVTSARIDVTVLSDLLMFFEQRGVMLRSRADLVHQSLRGLRDLLVENGLLVSRKDSPEQAFAYLLRKGLMNLGPGAHKRPGTAGIAHQMSVDSIEAYIKEHLVPDPEPEQPENKTSLPDDVPPDVAAVLARLVERTRDLDPLL